MDRPLYDELVDYYEEIEGRDWQAEVDLIARIMSKFHCQSIIDLGCGSGFHCRKLSTLGYDCIGVDIADRMIEFAKRRSEQERSNAIFVRGSYYAIGRKRYDCAICLNWSIPVDQNDQVRFMKNANRLLKNGGVLIFDYERISDIVWTDLRIPKTDTWRTSGGIITRVSLGSINREHILKSVDVYAQFILDKRFRGVSEKSRYNGKNLQSTADVRLHVDQSYVRFFSGSQLGKLAETTGFKIRETHMIPRNEGRYKRLYAVFQRTQ